MAVKLGSGDVSFRLGSATPAKAYLGSQEVWSAATVPGEPTLLTAVYDNGTDATWATGGDGGSPLIAVEGRFNGDEVISPGDYDLVGFSASWDQGDVGQTLEIRLINAIGPGPWSNSLEIAAA
jgi:hypothetical protein